MISTSAARSKWGLALGALALSLLGGCFSDPTEVVVVADTDMTPVVDFEGIEFRLESPFSQGAIEAISFSRELPATMGYVPRDGGPTQFDVTVRALRGEFDQQAIVTRRASGIRFVSGEMRVLLVTLLRACMCQQTNCPAG